MKMENQINLQDLNPQSIFTIKLMIRCPIQPSLSSVLIAIVIATIAIVKLWSESAINEILN